MVVAGTNTHKVGEVAQTLMGVAPSASTISRLNQTLTQQFDTWRQRPLQVHWRILYLDGVHFSIRHGDKADTTIILTAFLLLLISDIVTRQEYSSCSELNRIIRVMQSGEKEDG